MCSKKGILNLRVITIALSSMLVFYIKCYKENTGVLIYRPFRYKLITKISNENFFFSELMLLKLYVSFECVELMRFL